MYLKSFPTVLRKTFKCFCFNYKKGTNVAEDRYFVGEESYAKLQGRHG